MKLRSLALVATVVSGPLGPRLFAQDPVERRTFVVNVIDADGALVPGLTEASFHGKYRGEPVRILSATSEAAPRSLVLLLDRSGSMRGGPAAALIWSIAEEVIASLTPRHRVVLATLGEALQQHGPLSNDERVLREALERARAQTAFGPTPLFESVVRASRGFSKREVGDAVCLVSDGLDTTSRIRDADAAVAVAQTGIRMFVMYTPTPRVVVPLAGG